MKRFRVEHKDWDKPPITVTYGNHLMKMKIFYIRQSGMKKMLQ